MTVDPSGFLTIVVVAAIASTVAAIVGPRVLIPVVVLELVLGIVIGPDVLGLAEPDAFVEFFASLGLGMLFFFAGYEIDFQRIRGAPLKLAALGWLMTLALAYTLAGVLSAAGIVLSALFVGSAIATTAIGTLMPILSDAGELRTRFGAFLLAAGAVGEFGPILLVTLVLSTKSATGNALILFAFVAVAVVAGITAVRGVGRGWHLFERTLESSGQLAIRWAMVMVFALAALASELGLDLLLGGFVAGIILRQALDGREVAVLESKLTAVGYGFLIPFFFVVSGIKLDIAVLVEDPVQALKVPLFLAMFLVVRGIPALVLYRGELESRDRLALAFFSSTQLPLVVAITTIAIEQGHMRSATAASLVAAAVLSTAIYPLVGLALRRGSVQPEREEATMPPPAESARS